MEDNKNKQGKQAQDQQPLNENELNQATGGAPYWGYVDPFKKETPSTTPQNRPDPL